MKFIIFLQESHHVSPTTLTTCRLSSITREVVVEPYLASTDWKTNVLFFFEKPTLVLLAVRRGEMGFHATFAQIGYTGQVRSPFTAGVVKRLELV